MSAYLYFTPENIDQEPVNALITQVQSLVDRGDTAVTVLISCPGGSVYYGLLAHNYLKGIPIEVTTHNINTCDSISALIFAAGTKRLCVPHGRFVLHGLNSGFPIGANLSEVQLGERLDTIRNETDSIANSLATATGKSASDIHHDILQSTILSASQAVEYGLVHELQETLFPAHAEVIRVA